MIFIVDDSGTNVSIKKILDHENSNINLYNSNEYLLTKDTRSLVVSASQHEIRKIANNFDMYYNSVSSS